MSTTQEAIRDRVVTLITAITPTVNSGDKFRHWDDRFGDFEDFVRSAPAGAFRRFYVTSHTDDEIIGSLVDVSHLSIRITVQVAYPHDSRTGTWGRDRDDAIDKDWKKINTKIGIYGYQNFSATGAVAMGASKTVELGDSVDILVVEALYQFDLDVDV